MLVQVFNDHPLRTVQIGMCHLGQQPLGPADLDLDPAAVVPSLVAVPRLQGSRVVLAKSPILAPIVRDTHREGDTIVEHPDLINALVAAGNDPVARSADLAELRAAIQPFGFRRSMRFGPADLQAMRTRTLLIWGDHDPLGSVDAAQAAARLIPNARLVTQEIGQSPRRSCWASAGRMNRAFWAAWVAVVKRRM